MKSILFFLMWVLFSTVISGCQPTTTYYLNAKADETKVVSLHLGKSEKINWHDYNVSVDYELDVSEDVLLIEGVLSVAEGPRMLYRGLHDLRLTLFLLDSEMRVVSYQDIATLLDFNIEATTAFKREMSLLEGIDFYTFGYKGSFINEGGRRFNREQVWKLPKRN